MKRIATMLATSVLLVALAACAGEVADPAPPPAPPDQDSAQPSATEEGPGPGTEEGEPEPSGADGGSDPAPRYAWPLDGDGEPAAGDLAVSFDGSVELADRAAVFDGASGFASTSTRGPIETTTSFSVAAWVSLHPPTDAGDWGFNTVVSQLGDVAADFGIGIAYGRWNFWMKDADTNEPGHTFRASATIAVPDPDAWVHLVGVYDDDAGELRFYLDGEPVAVAAFTATWRAEGPLTIGRSQARGSAADHWPGAIADVRVFTTALGDDEVSRLTDGTLPAAPPPADLPVIASDAALPNGTYEYAFTDEEKAVVESGFSAAEAATAGGFDGEVTTSLRFEDGTWQQFFTFDGVVFPENGPPCCDGGLYRVEGDRLVLTNPFEDVVYRWSLDGDTLSLTLLEGYDPGERDMVALITEHDYARVDP
jgi:hypothetical protein